MRSSINHLVCLNEAYSTHWRFCFLPVDLIDLSWLTHLLVCLAFWIVVGSCFIVLSSFEQSVPTFPFDFLTRVVLFFTWPMQSQAKLRHANLSPFMKLNLVDDAPNYYQRYSYQLTCLACCARIHLFQLPYYFDLAFAMVSLGFLIWPLVTSKANPPHRMHWRIPHHGAISLGAHPCLIHSLASLRSI